MSRNLKEIREKFKKENTGSREESWFNAAIFRVEAQIKERIKELEADRTNELQIKIYGYDEWSRSIDSKISELNHLLGK